MNKLIKYWGPSGLLCCLILSSCMKDTPFMNVTSTQPIIEFGLTANAGYTGLWVFKGDSVGAPVADTAVGLVVASPQVLNESVTVNYFVDQSQIDAYNTDGDTSHAHDYVMLPSNLYTLPALTLTIAAQHRVGRIPVTLNFPSFPAAHHYALPLTIKNAVGSRGDSLIVSGNGNQFMWTFTR